MLDKSLIAQCAYTCDVMAKKLLKEKKKAELAEQWQKVERLADNRRDYLLMKEFFLSFLKPAFRTWETVMTDGDVWDRFDDICLTVPCHHYVANGIHIPCIVQENMLDVELPLYSSAKPFDASSAATCKLLPKRYLEDTLDYLWGRWRAE